MIPGGGQWESYDGFVTIPRMTPPADVRLLREAGLPVLADGRVSTGMPPRRGDRLAVVKMRCRHCGRVLDVFRYDGVTAWGRRIGPSRPAGMMLRSELPAGLYDELEARGLRIYQCHEKCIDGAGRRRVTVQVGPQVAEAVSAGEDSFEV